MKNKVLKVTVCDENRDEKNKNRQMYIVHMLHFSGELKLSFKLEQIRGSTY